MAFEDVELRHLRALRAVAEEGSFIGAADILGFSQAAISQQISGLERAVGQALFDRPGGPRPVTLTPAGRLLLRYADEIAGELEAAEHDLSDLVSGTAGRLRVGTYQSVSVQLLPEIVATLRQAAPGLSISLVEEDEQHRLIELLLAGEIDVTFLAGAGGPLEDPRLEMTVLGIDPFVAVLQADGPLAREYPGRELPAASLEGLPMVGQHPCDCQQQIDDSLRACGLRPRYVFRSNDNGALQGMVRAGMGPAVMPLLAVDRTDPGIVVKHLDPPVEPRTIIVAVPKGTTTMAAADRLIKISKSACRKRLARSAR
jgi:DNA-binding transcriptional LysR family regulator